MKFPFAAVELESDGSVHDPAQLEAARAVVDGADDVLVLVHGWNNDIPAARSLYERLTDNIDAVRGQVPGAAGRKIAVVGVLWPSIKWADEDDLAGGGASAADAKDALIAEIGDRDLDPSVAAQLQELVPELDTSATARQKYLDLLRAQLPSEIEGGEDAPPPSFLEGDADTAFERAGRAGGADRDRKRRGRRRRILLGRLHTGRTQPPQSHHVLHHAGPRRYGRREWNRPASRAAARQRPADSPRRSLIWRPRRDRSSERHECACPRSGPSARSLQPLRARGRLGWSGRRRPLPRRSQSNTWAGRRNAHQERQGRWPCICHRITAGAAGRDRYRRSR